MWKVKFFSALFFLTAGMFLLSGCGAGVTTTKVQTTEKNLNEAVKYEGPKARIAVASFKCKAAKCGGNIGSGIRDMLIDALVQSGKFIVVERGEGLEEIKKELELGQSGLVQQEKAPQPGLLEGADILVVGSIVAFEPNAGGVKGGIGGLIPNIPLIGGVKLGKEDAYIALTIRLIDVRTGRIINSTRVEGKASSFSVGGLGGGILGTVPLGGGLEVYKNTPMEKAVMVLIDNAVKAVEKYVPESYYRYGEGNVKPTASKNTSPGVAQTQIRSIKTEQKTPSATTSSTTEKLKIEETSIEGAWHGRYYGHVGSGEWAWVIWKNPDGSYGGRLNTTGTYPGKNIPIKIEVEGDKIKIGWVASVPGPMGVNPAGGVGVTFEGEIKGDTMKGTWMFSNGMDSGKWDGKRGKTELTPSINNY
ncbi:CsgG/HfaB family protein [Persephonella sp.]